METVQVRMTNLFKQLGLDSSPQGIARFINDHPLNDNIHLFDADCWSDAQKEMLTEMLANDDKWALVVDELSAAMRQERSVL